MKMPISPTNNIYWRCGSLVDGKRCNSITTIKKGTFFDQSNFFYLVLEYCNGGSLDKLIEVKTKFNFDKILQWTKEMIFGIEYLHSYNIMHRDIKPA